MQNHTEVNGLSELPKLVLEERRLTAGELRIVRARKEAQDKLDAVLEQAGVDVVTCEIALGRYEVRRQVSRGGHRYATVTPIPA